MLRSLRFWLAASTLFVILNVAGAAAAAVAGEMRHAGLHVVLALAGMVAVAGLAARFRRSGASADANVDEIVVSDRLAELERSVDAVALEVERIGEGQRFMTRRFAEGMGERARSAEPTQTPPTGQQGE